MTEKTQKWYYSTENVRNFCVPPRQHPLHKYLCKTGEL